MFQFDIAVSTPSTLHEYAVPESASNKEGATKFNLGLKGVLEDVIFLESASKNVEKFSVKTQNSGHQFVHVYQLNGDKVFVKCCSGICMKSCRKLVNCRTIDMIDICPHLTRFRRYIEDNWQRHPLLKLMKDKGTVPVEDEPLTNNNEDNNCEDPGDERTVVDDRTDDEEDNEEEDVVEKEKKVKI